VVAPTTSSLGVAETDLATEFQQRESAFLGLREPEAAQAPQTSCELEQCTLKSTILSGMPEALG